MQRTPFTADSRMVAFVMSICIGMLALSFAIVANMRIHSIEQVDKKKKEIARITSCSESLQDILYLAGVKKDSVYISKDDGRLYIKSGWSSGVSGGGMKDNYLSLSWGCE